MTQELPAHVVRRLDELHRQLATTAHGRKTALVHACADELGRSVQTVHRWLQSRHKPCPVAVATLGPGKSRKRRADAGRAGITEDELEVVSAALAVTYRENGKHNKSIADTVAALFANGKVTSTLSAGRIAKLLYQRGLHPAQQRRPTPAVAQQSLHPNHVWQVDASVCVSYYLSNATGLQVMDEKKFYKNKPQNLTRVQEERLIRYALADHFTHEILTRYYLGSECSKHLADFLTWCMAKKDGHPMHGVPFILQMDMGSANTSAPVLNMLERLNVQVIVHKRHNSRANGSVENAHNIVENGFEGSLAFTRVKDLEDLNAKALVWCNTYGANREHSRYRKTRHALWLTIRRDQLREAPDLELMRELATSRPQERRVSNNLDISFSIRRGESHTYDLRYLPGVMAGRKVEVVVNALKAPAIDVKYTDPDSGAVRWMTVSPVEYGIAGFPVNAPVIGQDLRQGPRTLVDVKRDRTLQIAWGGKTPEEAAANKDQGKLPFDGKIDAFKVDAERVLPTFIPKRGTRLQHEPREVESERVTCVKAALMIMLQMTGGRYFSEEWERCKPFVLPELKKKFGESGVPVDLIPAMVKKLKSHPPEASSAGEFLKVSGL